MILSAIIVAFVMAALSLKKLFGDDEGFEHMTCHSNPDDNSVSACAACEIKDIANCDISENSSNKNKSKNKYYETD
jgi:hypothetical protein